ncbi:MULTISPECIES: ABC transporter permease [Bacillus]|uniref:Peptide ABC transporter permease n=3 Tax=Bacillus cereus group TaxID=86661 RepID=A0A2C9YR34_BACTU|nr:MULTISPECIES: ABC transporter permease [Bacillus]AIK32848.1 binding--dependent transport system inner membrane component family protein [Bacillus anthracis]AJH88470.1 binding--dependent transport system inner membrane component family protein [Bacillus anthracis]EEM61354.1 Oligopeptide ABC transporter, permease [Bacillus thuringiensis serovar monterrey BGSC 4AJ1]EEM91023.1 Oligopeptide ABC transporter, permease [Bacillus thuringiensis serovar pulsiensis BGSC 4CC1]KGZ83179.1 peptide ABC tran
MYKVIAKRLLNAIPLLFVISIISFLLIKLAPGDPVRNFVTPNMSPIDVERIRKSLGLDQPIYMQYILWLKNILTGNFGYSLQNHRPVLDLIVERLPATIGLMGSSLLVSFVIAIPLGLFTGVKKNSIFDRIVNFISYVGISMPVFWFALLLIYLFSLKLNLLPSMGMRTVGQDSVWDIVQHGILPCMVLAFQNISVYMRYIRSSTIQQLEEDYVQIQYAYGASKKTVLFNHVLRNVLIPIITIFGLSIPSLVGGAFITETVFSWPGLGSLGVNAIFRFDYPIIMAITLLSSFMLILGNLIADILYGVVDPRIRMRG